MIKNFRDHAANERTFLAWTRTAIAIMAFGFLAKKFDLFLLIASHTLSNGRMQIHSSGFGNIAGLMLIVLGTMIVGVAGGRFISTAKKIDKTEVLPGAGDRVDVVLAVLLVLLGGALFFYLSRGLVVGP